MPHQKPLANKSLLQHRMNEEARVGYALALKYGARKTAALIRLGRFASYGPAIACAWRELDMAKTVSALIEIGNPDWAFCAIRYAPNITAAQRQSLIPVLSEDCFKRAEWQLTHIIHLSDDEKKNVQWIIDQR